MAELSFSTSPKVFFQGPYHCQNFSFPDSIIFYITKNPSTSKLYQKLAQSCKYFFAKNPIIILQCIHFTKDGWKTCLEKCKVRRSNCKKFGFEQLSSKLWITGVMDELTDQSLTPPVIFSRIYQSDVQLCYLYRQTVTIDQLLFLASKAKGCNFKDCNITDSKGAVVQIEKIIENLPKIRGFVMTINPDSSNISSNSIKKLLKLPNFSKIRHFYLAQVSDKFDIESMFEYLKTTTKNFCLSVKFREELSPAYISRLEAIVDELLKPRGRSYIFPYITCVGLNIFKQQRLRNLYHNDSELWKFK